MALQSIVDLCGDATFSDHPVSELTYSGSAGSKKRAYMALSQHGNLQVQNLGYKSAASTTSGRPASRTAPIMAERPYSGDLDSSLFNQNTEIDALFRFQTERLHSGMEQLRRKHSRYLLSIVGEQATKRMRVKEIELQRVCQKNMELEEQVRQMTAESQGWFNYARTTEGIVSSLKAKLGEILGNQNPCSIPEVEEGYGDSSEVDDTESTCEAYEGNRTCRVCRDKEVCVLLLPCRHLCLCRGCEAGIDTCPVCNSSKNASIQVLF